MIIENTNFLSRPEFTREVKRLTSAAAGDEQRWEERRQRTDEQTPSAPDPLIRMGELYLAVSEEEGRLLYLMARAARAKRIIEFGASYGVSTLYLGAAAHDNGGSLITTEVHPDKCAATRGTLQRAQLEGTVTLLEGDARETLPTVSSGIELLFLDGWKSQYRPLLFSVEHLLAPNALVIADNVNHQAAADYKEYVCTDDRWFTHLIGDMAVSILAE